MFNGLDRRARNALRTVFFLLGCLILGQFSTLARAADDFWIAVAFKFSASEKPGEVDVTYQIADGYYMYRERFAFATRNGTTTIGEPQLPAGHVKFDQTFNKNVETYRNELTIRIPVKQAAGPFDLAVTSQGCADAGICYPPMERVYHVSGAALQPTGSAAAPQPTSRRIPPLPQAPRGTTAPPAQTTRSRCCKAAASSRSSGSISSPAPYSVCSPVRIR